MNHHSDVLVVGAGPTGLVLALSLTRMGVRVRIVDRLPQPATTTRANLWIAGRRVARAPFGNIGTDIMPYPYVLIYSQDEHEHLLLDQLRAAVRRLLFRTVSQTGLNYRGSGLSEGRAGSVHGGDRLPWVGPSCDNFEPLRSLDWQAHVYGDTRPAVQAVCTQHRLPLHVFPWRPEFTGAGVRRDAVYLVRPDGYVALASAADRATAIGSYLAARQLTTRTKR